MEKRMPRSILNAGSLLILVIGLLSGACATAPAPTSPAPSSPVPSAPAAHTTAPGPPKDFAITQELTSRADILWDIELPGRSPISQKREAGLRILALFEVVERRGGLAVIRATMKKTEILMDGAFVPAPFLIFNPPSVVTFKVNYNLRTVDFTEAEKAYATWVKGIMNTPGRDFLSANFRVASYIAQLKALFGHTALDFAGNTYAFRRVVTEKKDFFVPLLWAGISLGPVEVDLSSSLRYVEVSKARKIFRIRGEQQSKALRMDALALGARMSALDLSVPYVFESDGNLKGTLEAQVDADSGWITELDANFTASTTAGYTDGRFNETVKGVISVVTR
jgi:hypothetical protein